jgi:hypothetical protein
VVNIDFEPLAEFHHGCRVTDIAWSSRTDFISIPRVLQLVCVICSNVLQDAMC